MGGLLLEKTENAAAGTEAVVQQVSHHHHGFGSIGGEGGAGTVYRFIFTKLRGSGHHQLPDGMQISEIVLTAADERTLRIVAAHNPGGQQPGRGTQGATAVCDGSLATKWFDGALQGNGSSKLLLQVAPGEPPAAFYTLYTANDNPRRDPSDWTLDVRDEDAAAWRLVDSAESVEPPLERYTAYQRRWIHYNRAGTLPMSLLAAEEKRASAAAASAP